MVKDTILYDRLNVSTDVNYLKQQKLKKRRKDIKGPKRYLMFLAALTST